MKDGRTHAACKAEQVVDLKSDLVLAAEIRPADHADTETLVDSVVQAQINLQAAECEALIEEVAADKGYHAATPWSGARRRLQAEMKLPGRAWLVFEVTGDERGSTIRQTALFDPVGLADLLYCYGIYPLHQLVFAGMLRNIARAATREALPTATFAEEESAKKIAV